MKKIIIWLGILFGALTAKAQQHNEPLICSSGGSVLFGGGLISTSTIGLAVVGAQNGGQLQNDLGFCVPLVVGNDGVRETITQLGQGKLFPNPTSGNVSLQIPNGLGIPNRLVLLDEGGRTVEDVTSQFTWQGSLIKANFARFSNGTYFIRVENNKESLLYKMILK